MSLYYYMNISQNCRDLLVMSMINFQFTMILGCFSAVNVLFVGIIIVILIPILIHQAWKHYRDRTAHARKTTALFKQLISKQYDTKRFVGVNECSICLDDFSNDKDCIVTPLPCANTKIHVFHSKCIKEWLQKEHICPLCKEHVHFYNCKELRENFENKYPLVESTNNLSI